MNKKVVLNIIGKILLIEAVVMLPALIIALIKSDQSGCNAFSMTIVITAASGAAVVFATRKSEVHMGAREGFVTVSLSWIVVSLFGALPFFLSRQVPNYIDCWFETVSGFTTTGASALPDVEALSQSMHYWRSFTHWLGGMGILVFLLAIVPMSKESGNSLYLLRAESPGPMVGKISPKLRRTARILYLIYIVLTMLEIILLMIGGMPAFDSVINSFATAGTGGFAPKAASIGAYNSFYLQGVIGVFMMLFGVNFNVFYFILIGSFAQAFKNEELRAYIGIMIASTLLIAVNISKMFSSFFEAFHHAFFQASSIMTTTGFATVDFNQWPPFSKAILLLLMLLGASAGSTGGGLKISRVLILIKSIKAELQRLLHPRSIKAVKMDGKSIGDGVTKGVTVYLAVFMMIYIVSTLIVALDRYDIETTLSSVLACIDNIGPGLGAAGPAGGYAGFSVTSKLVLSADMLIGRLEIYPMLLLFAPSTWKKGA